MIAGYGLIHSSFSLTLTQARSLRTPRFSSSFEVIMSSLPLEVKAAIIDLLASPKEYSAISLVWPDVIFRIREHRFKDVRLKKSADVRLLLEIIQAAPSVGPMVRKLSVEPPLYTFPGLPHLLATFQRIASVTLWNLAPSNRSFIHSLAPTATDVRLSFSQSTTTDDTFDILTVAFPAMESLMLRGRFNTRAGATHQGTLNQAQFAALRTLDLPQEILKMPSLLEHITARDMFSNVSCLIIEDVEVESTQHVRHLDQLLRKWDTTLKDLQLPRHLLRHFSEFFPCVNHEVFSLIISQRLIPLSHYRRP